MPTTVDGLEYALAFNGDQYVEFEASVSPGLVFNELTITFWIDTDGERHGVLEGDESGGNSSLLNRVGSEASFYLRDTDGNSGNGYLGGLGAPPSGPTMVVLWWDGDEKRTYFNTTQQASHAFNPPSEVVIDRVAIPHEAGGGLTYYDDVCDDLRIYNRALPESEIQALYDGQHVAFGLVGWWPFNEGSGDVAEDQSGNGNDGTLANDPVWVNGISPSATQRGPVFYLTVDGERVTAIGGGEPAPPDPGEDVALSGTAGTITIGAGGGNIDPGEDTVEDITLTGSAGTITIGAPSGDYDELEAEFAFVTWGYNCDNETSASAPNINPDLSCVYPVEVLWDSAFDNVGDADGTASAYLYVEPHPSGSANSTPGLVASNENVSLNQGETETWIPTWDPAETDFGEYQVTAELEDDTGTVVDSQTMSLFLEEPADPPLLLEGSAGTISIGAGGGSYQEN